VPRRRGPVCALPRCHLSTHCMRRLNRTHLSLSKYIAADLFASGIAPACESSPHHRGIAMSQHHQNSWRPRQQNRNYKAPRVSKWLDERQRDKDQIAPDGVSASANHLQRWALMTANMPQQPTKRVKSRKVEEEIRDSILRRYQGPKHHPPATSRDDSEPLEDPMVIHLTGDDAQPPALISKTTTKRPRSPSPASDIPRVHLSSVSYVQTIKRRRSRSPSPKRSAYSAFSTQTYSTRAMSTTRSEDDYDYAQSSEWSFPSSEDEDEEME
jgi:hypothetical protein